ncbi:hypothetical protein K8T06_17290, partial [bacterium]|nr:hypothetical protein [bacterium]
ACRNTGFLEEATEKLESAIELAPDRIDILEELITVYDARKMTFAAERLRQRIAILGGSN